MLAALIASSAAALRHRCQCCWGIGMAAATTMAATATFKAEQPTHLQRWGIISDTALRSSQPIVHWAPYMHSTSPPSWNATPAADIIGGDGISVAVVAMTVAMAATAPATTTKTIVTSTDCSNHIRLTATQILLVWRKSKTKSLWINISVIF